METDLFTTQKEDIIELAADMMEWRDLRFMAVETHEGKLEGLVSSKVLIQYFSDSSHKHNQKRTTVADIMVKDPITVHPDTPILEAIEIMQTNGIGCLPVVNEGNILIGIVTEEHFVKISNRFLKRLRDA